MPEANLTLDDLDHIFEELEQVPSVKAGIAVSDPEVAQYAHALEFGSIVGQKPWPGPGPRTTRAVNPETGEEVVVSAQAPQGFIRVHASEMAHAIVEQLKGTADWLDAQSVGQILSGSVEMAATLSLELLRSAAPHDSGRLRQNLQIVDVA